MKTKQQAEAAPAGGQHTPGPWKLEGHTITANDGLCDVAQMPCIAPIEVTAFTKLGEVKNMANARLIASAPALLEALRVALGQLESVQLQTEEPMAMPWPSIEQARAAIAQPEGRVA